MKKWKKWTALLCAGEMLVSLTACGTQPAGSDSMAAYAGQSVTGQITVLDGTVEGSPRIFSQFCC